MTMETILNLVWLAVTLAALWVWRFRWTVSRRTERRDKWHEAVAIVCVLALLFPVISLTDDLHPEVMPVDSISSKRNFCLIAAIGTQAAHSRTASNERTVFASVPDRLTLVELVFAGMVPQSATPGPRSRPTDHAGRAPPSLA